MTPIPAGWGYRPYADPNRGPRARDVAARILSVPHLAHGVKPADLVRRWGVPYVTAHRAIRIARGAA